MKENYLFRNDLVDALLKDLIGPKSEDETIEDAPLTHYVAGILYPPRSGTVDPAQDIDRNEDDDESGVPDPPVALANVRYPSSMGITFAVDSHATKAIKVTIDAARYAEVEATTSKKSDEAEEHDVKVRRTAQQRLWKRMPISFADLPSIDVTKPWCEERMLGDTQIGLFVRVRAADENGAVPVTLVLVNRRPAIVQGMSDAEAVFQPQIRVTVPDIDGAFAERPAAGAVGSDEDIRAYRLLYRHAREFGIGHGCSIEWDVLASNPARASALRTTFAPSHPVRLADSNPAIKLKCTGLSFLATAPRKEVLPELERLCVGYEKWIKDTRKETGGNSDLDTEQRKTADEHLAACEESLKRMRAGVKLLGDDDSAWKAFVLTNKAMLSNRARSVWLKEQKPTAAPDENDSHAWRPFQLAFLLLCLVGIADTKSADRDFADLLWFPTGGGKTEAYLGLIAFTVFLRRIRNADGGGITALMRYTMRLLTVQQFERAALLICCCELLRKEHNELGKEPISLGLWLGRGATPNKLQEARTALEKLKAGRTVDEMNPVQLHACPWCGTPLDWRHYWIATDRPRLIVSCREVECAFSKQLPVYLVDEDVYNYRPTLLIATVDKFAGLPWLEQAASLFNLKESGRPDQPPPELIIQDELHLISGPLGTLVGLYETALDAVCGRMGARPKTIASTATIRRAGRQARALFDRPMRQFPPPGIDARDSYFAVEVAPDSKGTRLYLGLMAPATSHTTLLVRAYAALLQNAADIPGKDAAKDPYWTLVGYFNSLRVLGGAKLQVQDDVSDRMELLARVHGTVLRAVENEIELTSREASSRIPAHLRHMAVSLPSPDTLDVILATNMISVGVDIDRLGLMVVMGQPQSTSEYIQSTSRVGRQHPGMVVVLFNAARSRDRSHYESFVAYHSALYRQVESGSVTPFSARARDRGLHAVLVSLARLLVPEFRDNEGAGKAFARKADLNKLKTLIVERVRRTDEGEVAATEAQLTELIDNWAARANECGTLVFRERKGSPQSLLSVAGDDAHEDAESLPTLWSLRDVDQESNLYLV